MGPLDGDRDGLAVVGAVEGKSLEIALGRSVEATVGIGVGPGVGPLVGDRDGLTDVGAPEGRSLGTMLGGLVGAGVGIEVGPGVGPGVGASDGRNDGPGVGSGPPMFAETTGASTGAKEVGNSNGIGAFDGLVVLVPISTGLSLVVEPPPSVEPDTES